MSKDKKDKSLKEEIKVESVKQLGKLVGKLTVLHMKKELEKIKKNKNK